MSKNNSFRRARRWLETTMAKHFARSPNTPSFPPCHEDGVMGQRLCLRCRRCLYQTFPVKISAHANLQPTTTSDNKTSNQLLHHINRTGTGFHNVTINLFSFVPRGRRRQNGTFGSRIEVAIAVTLPPKMPHPKSSCREKNASTSPTKNTTISHEEKGKERRKREEEKR